MEVSNDGKSRVVSERDDLLMEHKSKDTHHSDTAVVELSGTLGKLGLLIKVIPAEVNVSVTEAPTCSLPVPGTSQMKAHSKIAMKEMI